VSGLCVVVMPYPTLMSVYNASDSSARYYIFTYVSQLT
jgi:hypothetical protein